MADNIDLSLYPYNDRFDRKSGRSKALFRSDRPLQQAELNELQSIAEDNLRRLGDSIFADGAIQTGMAFSFDNKDNPTKITIEEGLLYLAGKIRPIKKQTIPFANKGTEIIGVKVVQKVITYNEDPTLLDQTQNAPSYLSPGADRLQEEVVLTYNDDTTASIYRFEDGKLFIEPDRPEFSVINQVLAQRTVEESGNYQVEGFEMWTEKGQDAEKIDLIIDKGLAYVMGYRISKPTSTRIAINKSKEFRSIVQETSTYNTAKAKVTVGSSFVKAVTNVVGRTLSPAGGVQISKGVLDGRDAIPAQYTNIDPTTVVLSFNTTVYVRDKDYKVVQDSGIQYIDWNTGLNGTEPTPGTTYKLTFEYDRVMKAGTDYKVTNTPLGEKIPGATTEVDFNGMTGVKPKEGGTVRVDYDYYLSREDIVTLDAAGNFSVIEGQPDREGVTKQPENRDPLSLKIGNIHIYPYSDFAAAKNTAVMRLRMEDLQKLKTRVENLEYNQALIMLEKQATKTEDPLTLRGLFADAFTDFNRLDTGLSSVSFSFDDATITIPTKTPDDQKVRPKFMENESVSHSWGRLVTAPFKEIKEISQPLATSAWNVNPYQVYNKQGVLKLSPERDNWIDEKRVTLYEEDHITTNINRWWAHQGEGDPNGKLSDWNQWLVDNTALTGGAAWNEESLGWSKTDKAEGVLWQSAQSTRDEVIEYMRQIEVSFTATNLMKNTDNLFLTFDGVRVPVTPVAPTVAGSQTGTIRSNALGEATGKFMIPAGIRTGTREVTLQNADNLATSTFSAQGTAKITTDTITKTRVTFNLYDPLAQSFAFQQARVITSVGVYFGSKSTTDNIIMQVRGLSDGGLPNRTVYAERILTPDKIKVSEDASLETRIALDDPLMVKPGEGYCIVFITDSADYTMWCATLGQKTLGSNGQTVVSQPYVNGVLFSSSNAVSWTVHQETDMKFNIYTAEFAEEGIIEFDTMKGIDSNGILLMASFLTPENTGCNWEVKIVNASDVNTVSIDSVPWLPLINYAGIQTPFVVGLAKLRATFKSNRYISPMLALDDLLFVNFVSATKADYVSKTIDQRESPFNTVTISYDAAAPAGTRVKPYYSLDQGATWKECKSTPTTAKRSAEFTRYTFVEKVAQTAVENSIKYKLTLEGDNRFLRPRVRQFTGLTTDAI
ncbi:putative adsorption associated tail protein [Bacillus phage BCP78]|uniref:Putative adsorption associated tail protein n=3 Tax=Tsarbombavirus BCP78 TaxID=1985182 RepID=J9PRE4_9CAUD|nr:putative adsorption associated tail protein [Bacillus phage BCP78]YP_009783553.1 putative adsorption associated tail protein [Bacillus phage BCU4]AEW47198.1 putative adsorption associated tail protein [Bacillus phage BCP78]AEW47686.1 putative adsorption associated tail protein [Bacillus phage BCU4]AQN32566.1 putative adsorption associated tail protein [Bacillus phage BCP12]